MIAVSRYRAAHSMPMRYMALIDPRTPWNDSPDASRYQTTTMTNAVMVVMNAIISVFSMRSIQRVNVSAAALLTQSVISRKRENSASSFSRWGMIVILLRLIECQSGIINNDLGHSRRYPDGRADFDRTSRPSRLLCRHYQTPPDWRRRTVLVMVLGRKRVPMRGNLVYPAMLATVNA